MDLTRAIRIAQTGFDVWAGKPHNARWARLIDGTPIPNDLVVCIAHEFALALALPQPHPLTHPEASAKAEGEAGWVRVAILSNEPGSYLRCSIPEANSTGFELTLPREAVHPWPLLCRPDEDPVEFEALIGASK